MFVRKPRSAQIKNKDYIEHNRLKNQMVEEWKDYYRELGLDILAKAISEEYLQKEHMQVLYTRLEGHIKHRPKREFITAIIDENQIIVSSDERMIAPTPYNYLTTQVSENEYNHLMWYWDCVRVIFETKIKLMQERL